MPMNLLLLRHAQSHVSGPLGLQHLLLGDDRILWMGAPLSEQPAGAMSAIWVCGVPLEQAMPRSPAIRRSCCGCPPRQGSGGADAELLALDDAGPAQRMCMLPSCGLARR